MSKKRIVLLIIDGWGIGKEDSSNPIYAAKPTVFYNIMKNYYGGLLQASGLAVGLPWGEEGNSEVGHLTIGAGKVLYQHYPRISLAIQNKLFFENKALLAAINHAVKNKSAINLIGLISSGNVHSSRQHLSALLQLIAKKQPVKTKLHLFTDGKDSSPRSAYLLIKNLEEELKKYRFAEIASLSGRYFAMNRDGHWDRTQEAYAALIGQKQIINDIGEYLQSHYQKELNDQFVSPVLIKNESNRISNNESLIFFNFREDSISQMAAAFTNPPSPQLKTTPLKNLFIATFTKYSEKNGAVVVFPAEKITNPLSKVLADNNFQQLKVAETEKYAHVTYFFNGLREEPFPNEYRVLIPSHNIAHHDQRPEMKAEDIATRVIQAIEEKAMNFILANFANPDIIAHTGNFNATAAAVKTIDYWLGQIIKTAANHRDLTIIITADHGNAERLINPTTGASETKHDTNPVPFYIIGYEFVKNNSAYPEIIGMLSDIAPTILKIFNLPQPPEMTGSNLFN